jgi:dienelactone hydrolase
VDKKLKPAYSTVEYLDNLYHKTEFKYAFKAKTLEEWVSWRDGFREELIKLMGIDLLSRKCELKPQILERKEFDFYFREKLSLQVEEGFLMPCYLLIPKRIDYPSSAVLALHGHGRGAKDVLGEADSEQWKRCIEKYNYDYAHQLALRGFITFVPEVRGFGEREKESEKVSNPREEEDYRTSCRKSSFNSMLLGHPIIGGKVWDIIRAIDYLQIREEVYPEKIACLGLSMGGTITMYTAAVEERIKIAVISCYLNTFKDSIMAMEHCECNYLPGILRYGEMYDICGLIAPRPLLIESGKNDPIFPFYASEFAFNKVKRVYELLEEKGKLAWDAFEGEHRFSGKIAFDWLKRWLETN